MQINQSKSKVWFSNGDTVQDLMCFYQHFDVQQAGPDEKYLGCPVTVNGTSSFDYLVHKFEARLNQWKASHLTHAGCLILIKSVLDSMPLYAMGTVLLPAKVIKKLMVLVRNFFWGGGVDNKKMAYVAWKDITVPKGMGGLGLRSLAEMNQALVLKNVWKIASEHSAPWVMVLRAKYYPQSSFLVSNHIYNCSKLWRNLVLLKPVLYDHMG